jgi:hypothetical protein
MLKVHIPKTEEAIRQRIKTLLVLSKFESNSRERRIYQEMMNDLKAALGRRDNIENHGI